MDKGWEVQYSRPADPDARNCTLQLCGLHLHHEYPDTFLWRSDGVRGFLLPEAFILI